MLSKTKITRDSILFVFGIAGIAYETIVSGIDRPTLLILFAGMIGLPQFLKADEKKVPTAPQEEEGNK